MDIIKEQQAQRAIRIKTIYFSIDKAMRMDANVDEEKLIAEAQMQLGTARRTIKEYLKELEINGKIVIEDGKIWTFEGYQAELILRKSENPKIYKFPKKYFEEQSKLEVSSCQEQTTKEEQTKNGES